MSGTLFDANLWVALFFEMHPHHITALEAFDACQRNKPARFCRATEQSYLRLITTRTLQKAYDCESLSNSEAISHLQTLQKSPMVKSDEAEPPGTRDLWLELAACDTPSPKVWMDAYLAAFAISAKLSFTTLDADFKVYVSRGLDLNLLARR